jgi:hypothetical protein
MCWTSDHLSWLVNKGEVIQTIDGKTVEVLEFRCAHDDAVMSAWAKHFRNHYCPDCDLDILRHGTPFSRAEYLNAIKLPDRSEAPGPSIRAGDFGEVLVADYMQYCLGYWVPRTRYANKTVRNESTKGSDIIGFRFFRDGKESPKDILAIFEAKAQFCSKQNTPRLQDAIDDSAKDQVRKAESLNAIKQRFLDLRKMVDFKKVERFQDPEDNPYIEVSGAAALISSHLFDAVLLSTTNAQGHPNSRNLRLIIIRGDAFMDLVHELFRRAADEA